MRIQRVDLADDALMAQLHAVEVTAARYGRPWADPESAAAFTMEHREVDLGADRELWAARHAGRVLGLADLWLPLHDNTDKAWTGVRVHPEHRGRGAGSALVEQVAQRTRERGRREVLTEVLVPLGASPEHPYRRFAGRHGFRQARLETMWHLSLPVRSLERLAASARDRWAAGYRLRTYVGGVPAAWQASLCDTENQLATDAPSGTVDLEVESLDPQRYQRQLAVFAEMGRERYTTVAVDQQENVVAYTDLVIGGGTRQMVWQWGTLVRREHRGHRLGLAVKVQNLRRLQLDHPERTLVRTGNADVNAPMLAINQAIGFRPAELCPQLQLRL